MTEIILIIIGWEIVKWGVGKILDKFLNND
jgi:hypothetical protein